jgi:Tat protein secretion system quality control protein TatD with DNase activity
VFGIDKSPSQVAKAISRHQQQHPNLTFHQVDAWDLNSVLKLAAGAGVGGFTVVFIDVSGSRRVGDVENLLMKYEQVCSGFGVHLDDGWAWGQ